MDYSMPFFKKINIIIIALFISLLIVKGNTFTVSDERKIIIKDVVISKNKNLYNLGFNQEVKLDYLIREAIDKGIPLVFKLTLKVVKLNEIIPNKTIKKEVKYYQIEYKTLRKIYRIVDINEHKYEYKKMDEAIQKMLKIEGIEFTFVDDEGSDYELWINVSLERKKLPKPLQVNFISKTWSISSENSIHKIETLN
tara:strand:+ start:65 stop:652 length:588 start_codon:yes stop_codon:yes gene_type:complete